MNGNKAQLSIFLGKNHIANLSFEQDRLFWHYTSYWQTNGFAVSPHLPLKNEIPAININRFLRNMLPEGHAFDELIQSVHVSRNNTFALIRALGLDTPGALVLRPSGTRPPEQGNFRLLLWVVSDYVQ